MKSPINHDYPLSKSDRFLALIRKVFHKYPEFRHHSFQYVARFSPWIPCIGAKAVSHLPLKKEIAFADQSETIFLSSPIILAAGANKGAERISDYANVGFGGISVGTATRHFRIGNTHRPRLGFIEKDRAIHNSMGLNNDGVEQIAKRVKMQLSKAHKKGLSVGISIAETPGLTEENEKLKDVLETFAMAYAVADYIEVNISCPNTGEDRLDLDTAFAEKLFKSINEFRSTQKTRKAVYAKLSPDLSTPHLQVMVEMLLQNGVNGLVLGNTYPTAKLNSLALMSPYEELEVLREDGDKGGLSGRPLYENMCRSVSFVKENYPTLSVMASGGIDHGYKIFDLLKLGVDAVQVYSVVAFRWMAPHAMNRELLQQLRLHNIDSVMEFNHH